MFDHKLLKYKLGWKGFDYAGMEKELNELGTQGWEAVGTLVPSSGNGQALEVVVIMKRARG
ncbi:DUF4177 domain-containing protein [Pseudonocardia sp. ICBG162]|uniref:DUF4177 domain-containing protein n=1 Tax=Pseudonocardia sp. ICBG162 TaxID=2846761 RepID=UPI001CF62EA3|nr:DUF4177 domain-containing protein [Pseudonocardia sp. ICBG162]